MAESTDDATDQPQTQAQDHDQQVGARAPVTGRALGLVLVAALAVGAGSWALWSARAGDPTPGPGADTPGTQTADPTTAPGPDDDPAPPAETGDLAPPTAAPTDPDDASALVDALLDLTGPVLNGEVEPAAVTVAGGAVRGALEADAAEFEANGWTVTGDPRVIDLDVVEELLDADPPQITVHACVDASEVEVRDGQGELVGARPPRSVNAYTFTETDGVWLLTGHGFADDPDC
ncbi:hypothetical protein [Cellulomonas bogoriensis]|uniref:Uncharacterized protein n=1 Tax=Cellulomonas bogoriensis 69B4 = DSM 16987 TaxID=1386082 RepID=A0A0A0BMZ4_9CELL|nr:hypothetical protein [Cellulomonas bogoriensis]KGM09878.1 hypothetical protein N869_05920 [Cellulomonas bogoriensis 69B4 = DSM 16987]